MRISRSLRAAIPLALLLALASVPASAKEGDKSLDLTLDVAGAPVSGFGTTLGFTIGGGYEIQDNLQLRGDISYYSWSYTPASVNLGYTRVPIAAGLRYFVPSNVKGLKFYGQAEVELSFDSVDTGVTPTVRSSESSIRVGLVPAVGVDYLINPKFSVGANFKYHIETDDYWIFGFGGSYHF